MYVLSLPELPSPEPEPEDPDASEPVLDPSPLADPVCDAPEPSVKVESSYVESVRAGNLVYERLVGRLIRLCSSAPCLRVIRNSA